MNAAQTLQPVPTPGHDHSNGRHPDCIKKLIGELFQDSHLGRDAMRVWCEVYTAYRVAGDRRKAAAVCNQVLEVMPDNLDWRVRLARNYLELNRPGEAVAQLDIARRYAVSRLEVTVINRLMARVSAFI